MIVRGFGRAVAGLVLVAAVAACDDNPLAENRDRGAYFRLSTSNAVVEVDDTISVVANVLNQYGAALAVPVTATACDASVSVSPDPVRSEYEAPERFLIAGMGFGQSCVIVNGGGVTDTIIVRVVPAAIDVTAPSAIVGSGETVTITVSYFGAAGGPAPGLSFDPATTTFSLSNSAAGRIDENGEFFAQSPGTTWIIATHSDLGVTRRDSVEVEVVPGTFNGTATVSAYNANGLMVEFDEGLIPFDDDTYIALTTDPHLTTLADITPDGTANPRQALIPAGTASGEDVTFYILNVGPDNVTLQATVTATADVAVGNTDSDNAAPLALGEIGFGLIAGERGAEVWYAVNITTAGDYRISFQWGDNLDKDAYVLDSNFDTLLALENGAATNPETGVVTISTPGTYYLVGSTWTPNPGDPATYRMTFTQQ